MQQIHKKKVKALSLKILKSINSFIKLARVCIDLKFLNYVSKHNLFKKKLCKIFFNITERYATIFIMFANYQNKEYNGEIFFSQRSGGDEMRSVQTQKGQTGLHHSPHFCLHPGLCFTCFKKISSFEDIQ